LQELLLKGDEFEQVLVFFPFFLVDMGTVTIGLYLP
jgi:hypothetical protein